MKTPSILLAALCTLWLLIPSAARAATLVNAGAIGIIRGPAGLDLSGEMTYAVNFSPNDPALVVNGVTFTPDTIPPVGATFVLPNTVAPWQVRPQFGVTTDDDNLEQIYEDIRWANAGAAEQLEAHLPVTAGQTYKLQLLIYENASGNRRWDIEVEGAISVDEFTSQGISAPATVLRPYENNAGVVFTQLVTATDTSLDIVMGNLAGNNDGADRNPIWQGLTLEHVVAGPGDTDGDGLPDAWETASFGNLAQTYLGDADSDTLNNGAELVLTTNPNVSDTDADGLADALEIFTHGTNPKLADSDGDGLSDGGEITAGTSPYLADTDGDGLTDGAEVNTHGTDPLLADTDGDDYTDGVEIANGTNPLSAASYPLLSTQVRSFSGGDQGEGLDLTGTFIAAARFGLTSLAGSWPVRGANFIPYHSVPGLTQNGANQIDVWTNMNFAGPLTADDTNLADVMRSIRYQGGTFNIALSGLSVGRPYKLQLLFAEACCPNRGFDVYVEDVLVADEFSPPAVQGGASGNPVRGAAVIYGFIATDSTLNIRLDKATVTTPGLNDPNAILNAMTVEEVAGADADGDGMDDLWEVANFGNLSQPATGDFDSDGLNNVGEFSAGTDPKDADTDNDGLNDGPEVLTHLTNPRNADTDGDGLSDQYEVVTSVTNPRVTDTDGDGYTDSSEVTYSTNPNNAASYPLYSSTAFSFSGGDAGEGLDLNGSFIAAARFCPGFVAGSWPVRDATFVPYYDVPGLNQDAVNEIEGWTTMNFPGTLTTDDTNLAEVVKSIRYQGNVFNISLTGLTQGRSYKLQLLFAEACCANRGFDIYVDNKLVADEFSPPAIQGGASGTPARGAVVLCGFVATGTTVSIRLDKTTVTTPALSDPNPILNALTLEELTLPDTDGDGLADVWEFQFFGSLTQTAAGDADSDGRNNAAEFADGTLPNDSDTDNDGLTDGAEFTRGTSPFAADSDNDGLTDGEEVATTHSDPLLADTDSDGFSDLVEVIAGSNPRLNTSTPVVTADVFTGGDAGEGLDLDGTFLYAFNFGTPGASGQARDANFTADNAPGITYSAVNEIPNWHAPDYGATANDDVVEQVMQSIRWTPAPGVLSVNLAGLEVGKRYKLQLLFAETGTARGFDVMLEGGTIVEDFFPGNLQGNSATQAAVVAFEFKARDTVLNIVLNGNTTGAPDKNPILSGVTLESLPPSPDLAITSVSYKAAGLTINITGTPGTTYSVDYSTNLTTWEEVWDSLVPNALGTGSWTDTDPLRVGPAIRRGFYKVRDPALDGTP